MNPKANGQLQREWAWLIAIYLFLGGVGSGAYTIGAINGLLGDKLELPTTIGLAIGFPALLIGSLALLADLGSPMRAIKAGINVRTSWIARGFWFISAFMVVSLVHLLLRLFADVSGALLAVLSVLGIGFAVATMAYTGILLGASKGIPFWRSGIVPIVFVVSALVTGHFTIMLGSVLYGGPEAAAWLQTMALEGLGLVILEALAIVFYLQAAYKSPDARESAERLLGMQLFVYGYVLLGLIVPALGMVLLGFAWADAEPSATLPVAALASALGLAGGLFLRYAVLVTGALPTLNIAGFQFRRAARPKAPKPGIGLLPPS